MKIQGENKRDNCMSTPLRGWQNGREMDNGKEYSC